MQQSILGDGMSLDAVFCWQLYVFAHCVRRCLLEGMAPPMSRSTIKDYPSTTDEEYEDEMEIE